MGSTTAPASQVITLPQGGGALHGIGEKFAPDLFTGTGNFTIPLTVPAGRNGFQPQLNLVYSTGNGNGPFGLGWSLSIPGVSRKTSQGIPRYDDSDTFLLSGVEDLVRVGSPSSGVTPYRPRTEGLFARILHHTPSGAATDNQWEVRSKDGLISWYGGVAAPGEELALVRHPTSGHIFAWRLTSTTDPFGNRIEYCYTRDPVRTDGPHHWDQLYLSEIRYADYGAPGSGQFLVRVKFIYDPPFTPLSPPPHRPDPFSDYRAGFEIRTIRRCTAIQMFTYASAEQPVRTYHLLYLDQRGLPPEQLPVNGVSLLSQVQVEGRDGATSEWLPPLEFGYTAFHLDTQRFFPVTGPDMPSRSLGSPDYELVDLHGNGLPDVLQMNGTVRYWRNVGGGQLDWPQEMRTAPGGFGLADPGVQLIDANGDGRMDLLVTRPGIAGYFPTRFGGLWDQLSFHPYRVAPSFDLKDPEVRLVDLDGDGVTDAIRSGTSLECFFNDPQQGWAGTRLVPRKASLDEFPNVTFSDPRVKWADMTGDGLQDIVLVYDRGLSYWPALGRGNWGPRVCMAHSPHFPWGYDPKRILLGDVDGDGLADLVYVEDTRVTLWINQSGNGWSDPITIEGTPPVFDTVAVRLADLCGNGVSGMLWSADAGELPRTSMFFLDLIGGIKPYLLSEMDNHLGAVTRVEYAPSTRFYLEDEQRPQTRWKTLLPFPVQVAARVEVIDAISGGKLTTEYRYHHGYWDGAEREFRGFGRVDQRDTETFDVYHAPGLHGPGQPFNSVPPAYFSPPTETRTWFHQGPIGDEFGDWTETDFSQEFWSGDPQVLTRPQSVTAELNNLKGRAKRDALRALRGTVLRTELYALDGSAREARPYTVTEHLYGVREESRLTAGEPDRRRIFFPYPLAQRTTQWERGSDPLSQFTFTEEYDAYGQVLSQCSIAVPRGRDFRVGLASPPTEPYLVTLVETTYAKPNDPQRYLFNRVARTTTYEIGNDGASTLFDLWKAIQADQTPRQVIGQTLNFYDGSTTQTSGGAFVGLRFGQIGDYGALVRSESLVLTTDLLQEAYKSGSVVTNPPEQPPYLVPGGTVAWTADYPQEFRSLVPPLAGYTYQPGGPGSDYASGYFVASARSSYDFHADPNLKGRGLRLAKRDPLGPVDPTVSTYDTTIRYDSYDLLPTQVKDPVGLPSQAAYDYRVLQPNQTTDPNGNRTAYTFTPLGNLASIAVMGKTTETLGDTLAVPGTSFLYDFTAFVDQGQPISVRTIKRVHHVNETNVPSAERNETLQKIEYSDGFGRLLQSRARAEDVLFGTLPFGDAGLPADQAITPGDAVGQARQATDPVPVVVSGWQIYDNKGQVVEKYEPFYSTGYDYAAPTDAQYGQKAVLYYDPRGHMIRTVNPDGSEQRVLYGVPGSLMAPDLTNPDVYEPTPWEAYTYDPNDNAGRTHPATSTGYQSHWNTPASMVIDALGRTVLSVARNGSNPATDWFTTRSTYDIRGNPLTVTDALGRVAFRHVYDLANRALRVESIDAGTRRTVLDAAGNVIEQRDSKGALLLHAYDLLNRPIRLWARDNTNGAVSLRERLEYGDGSDPNQPATERSTNQQTNLLGKLFHHYDEAGLLKFESYDLKGNLLEKTRQVIGDKALLAAFSQPTSNWQVQPFQVDWQPPTGTSFDTYAQGLLDANLYPISFTYDALNRIKAMLYPPDVSGGQPKQLVPHYNQAGALDRVALDAVIYVERIAYNAKGQRTLITYGNGVMTRYAYDPQTFRLVRLRSEGYTTPAALTYHPAGAVLQDLSYTYDLVGNILGIQDCTPGSGVLNNPQASSITDPQLAWLAKLLVSGNALLRAFAYDPLYRLLSASGREGDVPPPPPPWNDAPRSVDLTRARAYTEQYQYDPVGNLLQLQHQSGNAGFTRALALAPGNNRLTTVTIISTLYDYTYDYIYDASGNLLQETTSRFLAWDQSDRLRGYQTQAGTAEPSVYAQYCYDAGGQRVKKLVRKQGGLFEVTIYIDGLFEHHRLVQGSTQENNTLHIMDNQQRIALVRVGDAFPGDATPEVTFHLGDHLGSSSLVIDKSGAWTNREEYFPYGETSFGSFARKRYRFSGKERDEESGLYYHGARYYLPWLARWASNDPAGTIDGLNLYVYVRANPLRFIDPSGRSTLAQKIDKIESPLGWFFAKTGYDIWNAVSLGTLSQVEGQTNLGTAQGLGESLSTGARNFSNMASFGLQDRIYEAQMKEGPGAVSIAHGVVNAGKDLLPIEEADVLANPNSSAADKWRAGGMALSKTANLFALGLSATGKNIRVPDEKGMGTHPDSMRIERVRDMWQRQASRGQLRKTPSTKVKQRAIYEKTKGKLSSQYEVDHIVDKQLGGAPKDLENLQPLDAPLNRAAGNNVQSQVANDQMGQRYDRVLLENQRTPLPDVVGSNVVNQVNISTNGR